MKKLLKFCKGHWLGVKNLIRWFPIIYKDRDWDNYFLEELLITKLSFQADYFKKYGIHVQAEHDAKRMKLVIKLLKRCRDDYYASEYQQYYQDDYYIDEHLRLHWTEPTMDNLGLYYDKYPRVYKQAVPNSEDRLSIAIKMAQINQERAYKLAYKIIGMYSPGWWD